MVLASASTIGNPVRMRQSDFCLVKDGELAENWLLADELGVMQQLGIEPLGT